MTGWFLNYDSFSQISVGRFVEKNVGLSFLDAARSRKWTAPDVLSLQEMQVSVCELNMWRPTGRRLFSHTPLTDDEQNEHKIIYSKINSRVVKQLKKCMRLIEGQKYMNTTSESQNKMLQKNKNVFVRNERSSPALFHDWWWNNRDFFYLSLWFWPQIQVFVLLKN